jgi:hypothetical protein
MHVNLRLHGGELVTLSHDESACIYDTLWSLAPHVRGAISAAGKLHHAREWRIDQSLDLSESSALSDARARLKRGQTFL